MKKLIITTVCCLLAQFFMPVNAQTWDKTIADGEGKCIIQTYDGGYVVGGGEESFVSTAKIFKFNKTGDTLCSFTKYMPVMANLNNRHDPNLLTLKK